jgi:hypothetical protein
MTVTSPKMRRSQTVFTETRTNWLSEIIEEKRIVSDQPIPLDERKAERDAIVGAIRDHQRGTSLREIGDLPDVVWEALGSTYHWERDAKQTAHVLAPTAAIHASLLIFSAERSRSE